MRVLVSGSGGLIGSAVCGRLAESGGDVARLVRDEDRRGEGDVVWHPAAGEIDAERLGGLDAVVHLAGEPIAGRWTAAKKRRIRDSRVEGTRVLCEALAAAPDRPGVLACASAVGYYGDRGEAKLDEASEPGEGFLPGVCRAWEAACEPARRAGIRCVNLRFGIVLSTAGGALQRMLGPFRAGLGGRIGSGKQFWSWITLADAAAAVEHVLACDALTGAVNVSAPEPVRNAEFTRRLAGALHRPAVLPMPAFAARLALGEMADEMLLASARMVPARLEETGFAFGHPTLAAALAHALGDG